MALEREVEKINKEFNERDYTRIIDSTNLESDDFVRQKRQYTRRKRGRPFNNDLGSFIHNINNNNSAKLIQRKRYTPHKERDKTPRKRRRRNFFDYLSKNYGSKESESNDMNLLEILFKEYGYNNIVYILTGSPDIKLGK